MNDHTYSSQINRQAKLATTLQAAGLDGLVLNPGPSLVYLTGLHFHLSERPVAVIFVPDEIPVIVLPELELEKVKNLPYPIQAFPYGEDPALWDVAFRKAVQATKMDGKHIGVEPRQLRLLEFRLLLNAALDAEFVSADTSVARLRMFKDESEISAMRKAAGIAQNALQATLPQVKIGCSERELAAELTLQLLRAGCDSEVPFAPIVSGGPNAANPHATPSNRKLSAGDLLVIDWGASSEGYFSDITRTFAIGDPEPELKTISSIVLEANAKGRTETRPGIPAEQVDQAARKVIESAGYGKYFTHRPGATNPGAGE